MTGVTTPHLPPTPLSDSVMVNRGGSTMVQSTHDLAQQIGGVGPIADLLAEVREAAFDNATRFETTSAGLAVTLEGQHFRVASSDPNVASYVYRHDAGPVATLIETTPSVTALADKAAKTALDRLSARLSAIVSSPAIGTPVARILAVEIYTAAGTTPIVLPAQIGIREIARDALHRFRLRLAGFDGVSTYTAVLREQGNGTYLDVTGYTGERWINLYTLDTSLGPAAAVLIGRARVDFGAGETFGTYVGTIAWSVGGLYADRLQSGPRATNDIDVAVTQGLAQQEAMRPAARKPFADTMSNAALRRVVRGIEIYGAADPARQYIISQFNVEQLGGPITRALVDIKDLSVNAVVARYAYSVAAAPSLSDFVSGLPDVLRLDDFSLPPAPNTTRVTAFVRIDKAAITGWLVQAPTTVVAGGIHSDCQRIEEWTADYLDRDHAHQVIRVGAGQDHTTLRAAVESTYGSGTTALGYRRGLAHYNHRQRIELVDDATYQATYLDAPEFVEIAGQGRGRTRVVKENNNANPLLELPLDTKLSSLTLYSDTGDGGSNVGQYCVHFDDFNRRSRGGKTQNRRIRQSIKNCDLIGGPGQRTWLLGAGISSGGEMLIEEVRAWHEADLTGAPGAPAAFGIHNTGPTKSVPTIPYSDKPSRVRMRGCSSTDQTTVACYVQTIAASARCTLDLLGCEFWMVRQDVAISLDAPAAAQPDLARDRFAWSITGSHAGAILQIDPLGLIVLATTPGVAVSGDAAALIFGAIDNLGRGEKWIKDGSTTCSLGKRLGDCSSVNRTLTIGAQTHTFNTDLTAVSNMAIIAAINASITGNPVSEVDIQHEIYPDVGTKSRVKNSSGSTIPKGRAVKLTGLNAIALCGAGERPDGWTFRAIPADAMGEIITGRRIATQYLDGAAAATGDWGVNASGQIDYAAVGKLGRTIGGVVMVW